ncbi:MAG: acyl-CoA carboxylase subunit beta [Chthoniobacteraceae bacterium]|nr:acyl-CoA carboxylase subunit beta [Chthoniobacteraceae bacterium]
MAIEKALIDELRKRRETALNLGGKDKIEKRHAKGLMSARDRLDNLFTKGTFQEFGQQATHRATLFGMMDKILPADGVVTGVGEVDGRPVAAFSQDFTTAGGSLGNMHAEKICDAIEYAIKNGMPVLSFNDSGGARIQEGISSLSGYGKVFYKNVEASGVVPQITIIAGPCAGGAAYSPALTDFQIMVNKQANMFICGPEVIKSATGEVVTMDEVGSAAANASVSGNVHFVANDDAHAIALAKKLLSFLPSNNIMDPPHHLGTPLDLSNDPGMDELVPADGKQPINVHDVIKRLVDGGDFFEVHMDFAKNIVVGFARIQGIVVGIVGNQPAYKAGTLDIDASDKGARFIRFCNIFNIPLVTLVDTGGFLPGKQQERGGIIRHGAKMLFAYASTTVPKITVIMRKSYGGAYIAMCSKELGADAVFAWPTAEIAVMGAEGAVGILYKDEIKNAADPKARRAELIAEYRAQFASPYKAAGMGSVTDVIEPSETRAVVARALRNTLSKREIRPAKKHGNIPL